MMRRFTFPEEEILCRGAGACRSFNKSILKKQHAENASKSAYINVLELMKF